MKFPTQTKAIRWYDDVFCKAARIVEGDTWGPQPDATDARGYSYRQSYEGRDWFGDLRQRFTLHEAVYDMVCRHLYRPDDWQQLLLEWPHKSESDSKRLAYTRDERAGEADRQVVTTIGKYLTRHFSHAPDNLIRDVVAKHTYAGAVKLVTNLDEMISAVINGPASCMTKELDIKCDDGIRRHPYAVYDPSLGWGMAVRQDSDCMVLGRCLVWHGDYDGDADFKCYVRSYKRERAYASHSGSDEAIETYLKSLGYKRESSWPDGTPLMEYKLAHGDGWLMPYIDGSYQNVDAGDFVIHSNGDLDATNTDGTVANGNCTCEECGARFNDDDEGGYVGVYEDHHVCQNCLDNDYTYAYSRRGNEYYIPNDRVVEVGGECYDSDYLSDNGIVELANGDYEHHDNAVYIERDDAYYHCDDNDICFAQDTDRYELKSDCWQCAESNNWYTGDEECVEIDGETYHPDHAPEVEAEEDDNTETN